MRSIFEWVRRVLEFNPVSLILRKFLNSAHELAQANKEDDGDVLTKVWYVFVMIAGVGFGVWAARWYLHSIPHGDYSMGGMIFLLIDMFVFALGYGVGVTLMAWTAKAMSSKGRPIVALAATGFLFVALYLPMHEASRAEDQKRDESRRASQLAAVEVVQEQTAQLPFVVPTSVPEMLEIKREGDAYRVRNRSGDELAVSFALALFHGKLLDRCWAGVKAQNCEPGSVSCTQQTPSGIPGVPDAGANSIDIHPVLAAGEARIFVISHCEPRFADGMLDYYVWSSAEKRFRFRSESALIPDYH
jgi:hypothetical protein